MPTMIGPGGVAVDVPEDQIPAALATRQYTLETPAQRAERVITAGQAEQVSGAKGAAAGFLSNVAGGMTLGAFDAGAAAQGDTATMRDLREKQGIASTAGTVVGAILPSLVGATGLPTTIASDVGKAVTKRVGGGVLGTALGTAAEGSLQGIGGGISELALSDDHSIENIAATLTTSGIYGGAIGFGAGVAGSLAEKGIAKAKGALEEYSANAAKASEIPPEIAALDKKGLDALETSHKAELETARVGERASIAEDLQALRKEMVGESKIYLATKGEDVHAIEGLKELSAQQAKADTQLRNALNNRVLLAEKPEAALNALKYQQGVLEDIQKLEPQMRPIVAADSSGTRAAGLDAIQPTLDKNLALQTRIKATLGAPTSPTLDAISKARELAATSGEGLGGKIGEMGKIAIQAPIAHAVAGLIPIPGVGHLVGAWVAKKATDLMLGGISKGAGANAARSAAALGKFLNVAEKAAPSAVPTAVKIFQGVRYAPPGKGEKDPEDKPKRLDDLYRQRTAEIRANVVPTPEGPQMRDDMRERMAEQFKPLRAFMPLVADKLETLKARHIEYLADQMPKKPDLVSGVGGPDLWKPSETDMRTFARVCAAVDDPGSVEEHLADGTITPEEASAYNACYPERAAHFKQAITMKLPELRASLSYAKRVALSIFAGVPVDPAMDPTIKTTLQATFAPEGGATQSQTAQPQFGSVKKSVDPATPAQQRGNPT